MQQGSLIECVENCADEIGFNAALRGFILPEIGAIYTCEHIGPDNHGDIIVWIVELKQHNEYTGREFGYPIEWFRELQPPTNIADELFSHAPETCEA